MSGVVCVLVAIVAFPQATETKPATTRPGVARPKAPDAPSVYVVRAERAFTASGEPIASVTIVVRDGKIATIGSEVEVPAGAIELAAVAVTPGLIDGSCSAGIQNLGVEDASEITPVFRATANLDSESHAFERLARSGVTTVFVPPSNRNVIGGLAGIVKSAPVAAPRVVSPAAALKAVFGSEPTAGNFTPRGFGLPGNFHVRRPGSRPGTVMELRLALFKARAMVGKLGEVPPEWKPLVDVLESGFPIRIYASTLVEIRSATRVLKEFEITSATIEGALEAHRAIDELRSAKVKNIVLYPHAISPPAGLGGTGRTLDLTDIELAQDALARLTRAGFRTALSTFGGNDDDDLAAQMRIAIRYGATREVALQSVTSSAAEILNINDRTGSLAAGKDADLVLWTGDPFELTSAPSAVIVDGKLVYQKPAQK